MNKSELDRFFLKGFKHKLGYPELLINMIINGSPMLELVLSEQRYKGLELSIFKLNY